MPYLYINENGAVLSHEDNCFKISSKNGTIRTIPSETLEGISIFGAVQVTTQCIERCLKKGINISFYSPSGAYFGRIISTGHINTARQKAQARLSDTEDFRLAFSKKIIEAKIHNQQVLIKRYLRSASMTKNIEIMVNNIVACEKEIKGCESIQQVMGYEGSAARVYFSMLSKLINKQEFKFDGRNKRPPKDAFNSMISLGYSILLNEVYGEIENKGLNPYFGFLHSDRENHPTLASDLMEEWRAVIVDSTVMSLINGNEISIDHFYKRDDSPGIFLDRDGMKIFIAKLEKKFAVQSKYLSQVEFPVSFRRGIGLQIESLVRAIENDDINEYTPVRLR